MNVYRIRMLGGLMVTSDDLTVERFRTRKTGALLAYLAYHPRRQHAREPLIELFWPAAELEAGRQSLSMALSALRTALEPERTAEEAIGLLLIDRHTVGLNPMCFTTDVAEFEAALDAADRATGEPQRERLLRQAISLYLGDLLPGHYDEWIFPEQQRLAGRYGRALRHLSDLTARTGATDDALDYALRAAGADPLDEAAARQAMRLLALCGRMEAAAQHYHELERRLREQWDIEPEPGTRALLTAVQTGAIRPTGMAAAGDAPDDILRAATSHVPVTDAGRPLEAVGGAMPPGSRFYLERVADNALGQALARGDGTILLKGARQVGKTSLLARGMQRAREMGCRVAHTHFQLLHQTQFATAESFLLCLAQTLAEQLDLEENPPEASWDAACGPNQNLRRWLRREVLGRQEARLVTRFVTCGNENTAKVWDAISGHKLLTLKGHKFDVNCAAFSADGKRIVTGSNDETAKVWDAFSGRSLLTLNGHSKQICAVAFSMDGKRIVTGSYDNTAKVWDGVSGRELLTLKGHEDCVNCVAFSPDGNRIVTGSEDRTAKVWDAATPQQVAAWQKECGCSATTK